MHLDPNKTVREFATETMHAIDVLDKFRIDYGCESSKRLQEACQQANISVDDVLHSLEVGDAPVAQAVQNYLGPQEGSLASLIHILKTHHEYVKREVLRLRQLLFEVVAVHCASHPELAAIQRAFGGLANELTSHMIKEETVLFPYIEELEQAKADGSSASHAQPGSINNLIHKMEHEHGSADKAMEQIRVLTAAYTPPETACLSYKALFSALREFESDLRLHEHLENNILFPRAIALETSCADIDR